MIGMKPQLAELAAHAYAATGTLRIVVIGADAAAGETTLVRVARFGDQHVRAGPAAG